MTRFVLASSTCVILVVLALSVTSLFSAMPTAHAEEMDGWGWCQSPTGQQTPGGPGNRSGCTVRFVSAIGWPDSGCMGTYEYTCQDGVTTCWYLWGSGSYGSSPCRDLFGDGKGPGGILQ